MRRLSFSSLLILVGLAVVLQGCSAAAFTVSGRNQEAPGTVLFADDFSDPPTGWGTWNRPGAQVDYYEGGLRILVNQAHYDFWSVAGKRFHDVQIEVDAVRMDGPADNDYGIICRYVDRDNFYMLVVSSDGYYGAAKLKEGQYRMIGSDRLQYSSVIAGEQSANRLRADCMDDWLSLYANGQLLIQARDGDFSSGDVGLIAGAYASEGVDIFFDNFIVKVPEEQP